MIGKGAQYLTAAGFGRYRITAASLGSLDLLGTFSWLTAATKQAIMAAFGVDGTAVIQATNEYLNGIAASDKAKAQQIADWLNAYAEDDARIVISLIPTLGERWIVGDGSAYIDTGRYMEANGCIDVKYRLGTFSNYPMLMGTKWSASAGHFAVDQSAANNTEIYIQGYLKGYTVNQNDVLLNLSWTQFTFNGTTVSTGKTATTSSQTVWLGGVRSYSKWRGRLYYYIYKEDGAEVTHFIPYCKNNVNGWIDLLSGTFYPPLAGTFGIEDSYTP